jgi:hypothetical protein
MNFIGRIVIILMIIFTNFNKTSGQVIFQKSYLIDSTTYSEGTSFVKLSNYDYLCLGRSYTSGNLGNLYLSRIDSLGEVLWSKTISDTSMESNYPLYLTSTDDGNYIISSATGFSTGMTYDYTTASLSKINDNGNLIWNQVLMDTAFYRQVYVNKSLSRYNNYYSCGYSVINGNFTSNPDTTYIGMFTKTDSIGNLIWTRQYGQHSTTINDFALSPDGGFLLVGREEIFDSLGSDQRLIYFKVDSFGIPQWAYQYDVFGGQLYSVIEDSGGYLLAGTITQANFDPVGLVIKIDYQGNILWSNRYGSPIAGDDQVKAILRLTNKKIAGYINGHSYFIADSLGNNPVFHSISTSLPQGTLNQLKAEFDGGLSGIGSKGSLLYFFKTDSNFYTCINNSGLYQFANISVTNDTFVVIDSSVILTVSFLNSSVNLLNVIDTTYCLTSTSIFDDIFQDNELKVYPNPTSDFITFRYKLKSKANTVSVVLSDLSGRPIKIIKLNKNEQEQSIDLSNITAGSYLLSLNVNNMHMITRKVIVIK